MRLASPSFRETSICACAVIWSEVFDLVVQLLSAGWRVNFGKIAMNFDLLVGGVRPANHNDCVVRQAGFLLHVIKYLLPYVLQDLDSVNLFALNFEGGR